MNIIIPLAGNDKNFEERGMIKPLTKVNGKEIIKWISGSRPFSYENAIFIILKEHVEKYNLEEELKRLFGENIKIIILPEMTKSSPHSILKVKDLINNEEELLIDLADQYLDLTDFKNSFETIKQECDGILTQFESYHYNRGYMLINKQGFVTKVSEKDQPPISTHSTACISYFAKGSDFVKYAEQMINLGHVAANGAYLPNLVYNEMISAGKKIKTINCDFIAPLGSVQGADCFEQINRPFKWQQNEKRLILHRGYKGKFLENSEISFEQALKQGYSFETDIRIYNEKCYMKHDVVLDSDTNLCSLETLCGLINGVENKDSLIFMHIKELNNINKVMDILNNYDFEDRIRFFGCDEITLDLIEVIKTKYPKYKVGLHYYENSNFGAKEIEKADFIWADEITKENISIILADLSRHLNKLIYVISPELIPESVFKNDVKKRWKEFLEMQVDGICTDRPDEFLEFASTFKKD